MRRKGDKRRPTDYTRKAIRQCKILNEAKRTPLWLRLNETSYLTDFPLPHLTLFCLMSERPFGALTHEEGSVNDLFSIAERAVSTLKTRKRFTLSLSLPKNSKEEKTLRLRVSAFKMTK